MGAMIYLTLHEERRTQDGKAPVSVLKIPAECPSPVSLGTSFN